MDARRVFIDQGFFQQTEILKITEEVLFTWSKQHKEKYQQGMLYILDIIIYIVSHCSGIDPFVNSYMVFDRVMNLGLSSYFGNMFGFLRRKCDIIQNSYLKTVDVEFFIYLNRADVDISVVLM